MIPDLSGCAWERAVSSRDLHTPDSADRGSTARREERTGECMRPPFDRDVPGLVKGASLRGNDAAFWAKESRPYEHKQSHVAYYNYPYDDVFYPDEYSDARMLDTRLRGKAELKTIPLEEGTQTLYHWTDKFPGESVMVEKGSLVVTYGYIWTSTAEQFLFKCRQRLRIVLPQGANVEAFIDPQSHSASIHCDGTPRDNVMYWWLKAKTAPERFQQALADAGIQERHHNDVVLPPSEFRIIGFERDWDLVSHILKTYKQKCDPPGNVVDVELDPQGRGWLVRCKDAAAAAKELRSRDRDVRKFGIGMIENAVTQLDADLLLVLAASIPESPVLEWVNPWVLAPPYPEDSYTKEELADQLAALRM